MLPLVFASGAGQYSRHSLGTAVFSGMVLPTLLNLFFIPVLYVLFQGARERRPKQHPVGEGIEVP